MKYRQLKTNFWEDNYILDLEKIEKLFFIYLFSNPKVNMTGIYELPNKTICYTLDLTLEQVQKLQKKFQKDEKYYFYDGWVFISNFSTHNIYSSAKPVVSSYINEFNAIPSKIRNHFFNTLHLPYEIPIKGSNLSMVMVKDKDKDKYGSPRVALRLNEDIDPEDVPV